MKLARYWLIIGLLLPAHTLAEDRPFYTWVDENGVLNYSQIKPKGTDAEEVRQSVEFGRTRDSSRVREPQLTALDIQNQEAQAQRCVAAREYLAKFRNFRDVLYQDESDYDLWKPMPPEMKAQREQEAVRLVAENCADEN